MYRRLRKCKRKDVGAQKSTTRTLLFRWLHPQGNKNNVNARTRECAEESTTNNRSIMPENTHVRRRNRSANSCASPRVDTSSHLFPPDVLQPVFLEEAMGLHGLELPGFGEVSDAARASHATSLNALVKSRQPSVVPQVFVRKGFGQAPCHTDTAVPRGKVQRCVPVVVDSVNVKSVADERGHFLHSAIYCCLRLGML